VEIKEVRVHVPFTRDSTTIIVPCAQMHNAWSSWTTNNDPESDNEPVVKQPHETTLRSSWR